MARSRGTRRRHDDDDDEDRPIRKKGNTAVVVLAASAVVGLLLVCLLACGIGAAVTLLSDPTPARLPGSWSGRFVMGNVPLDVTYTFNTDGTFREQGFMVVGRRAINNVTDGRWRYRNGQIEIDWNRGTFERATVTWVDENTMNYRIVDHSQAAQIGLTTTFRRQ
jgi:hypothetical protein